MFIKARFFELMLLLRTERLLDGPGWVYAIRLDGYRALAIKSNGKVQSSTRLLQDNGDALPTVTNPQLVQS